jgi:hypothetical protein
MKRRMAGLSGLVGLLLSTNGWATDYYISSSDPHAHDCAANGIPGTEAAPWKHLDQATIWDTPARRFQLGDRILLKRGDVFTRRLTLEISDGTRDQPIIVGAYGDLNDARRV